MVTDKPSHLATPDFVDLEKKAFDRVPCEVGLKGII